MTTKTPTCTVESVRRDGNWILLRIHGETVKLSIYGAMALGYALTKLASTDTPEQGERDESREDRKA